MQQTFIFSKHNKLFFSKYGFIQYTLLCLVSLATTTAYAQKPFVTTWKTDNPGLSNNKSIIIPTQGGVYKYDVDWNNDGIFDQIGITGGVAHDFGLPGTFTIQIRGTFPRIFFNNAGDKEKLLAIKQWGDVAWTSMEGAFSGCKNLNITATDVPNMDGVTSMAKMFSFCEKLNGPANIGNWNTTNVTNISGMFKGAHAFNRPVGSWNTPNVTDMSEVFSEASLFNQPLFNWNTGKVTNMTKMFYFASSFNQNIDDWNTANVTSMSYMFGLAKAFNQPISNWNTSKVTKMDHMFSGASLFNQPIGDWKVSGVTKLQNMFSGAKSFNQPIGNWNTANVDQMSDIFRDASSFNQPIGNWKTAKVNSFWGMFKGASSFNQPIGNWNTDNVEQTIEMFAGAKAFNQPIGNWNMAKVFDMGGMFQDASSFNQPIGNWNTAEVAFMTIMFSGAISFNQPIGNWNTAKVTDMLKMFSGAKAFNQSLGKWLLNPAVNMVGMLDNSGMDCKQYSATLIGWNANPATPKGRVLGAIGNKWGTNAQASHLQLDILKGWTFVGDANSGVDCSTNLTGISSRLTGEPRGNDVLLSWQMPLEANNQGFEVERSTDGDTFEKIGFVGGNEDTNSLKEYRFTDENSLSDTYYRLKQVDNDGYFEYSEIISVKKPEEKIVAYPNPVVESFYLKGLDGKQNIVVKDAYGKIVYAQPWSPGMAVKMDHLPDGTYYVSVAGKRMRLIVKKQNP